MSELMHQGVGDAIADLLCVELALYHKRWEIQQWDAIYTDLPSTMLKVKVQDRNGNKNCLICAMIV